jgi:hypothetical protein
MQNEHLTLFEVLHEVLGWDDDESWGNVNIPRRGPSDLRPTDMSGLLISSTNKMVSPSTITMAEFMELPYGFTIWLGKNKDYYNIVPFEMEHKHVTFHAEELMVYYSCGHEACIKMMPMIIDIKQRFLAKLIYAPIKNNTGKKPLTMVKAKNGT